MFKFAVPRRIPSRLPSRLLSSTTRLRAPDDDPKPPQPPKPIDDSTSALDYKRAHQHRPPPLPAMDVPRSRSAEEAVTNILYNTPPPSLQPFKKYVLLTFYSNPSISHSKANCALDTSLTASSRTSPVFSRVYQESSPGADSTSTRSSCAVPRYATSAACV